MVPKALIIPQLMRIQIFKVFSFQLILFPNNFKLAEQGNKVEMGKEKKLPNIPITLSNSDTCNTINNTTIDNNKRENLLNKVRCTPSLSNVKLMGFNIDAYFDIEYTVINQIIN